MKLQSFLRESVENTKAWATISQFTENEVQNIKKIVESFKSYRLSEETVDNPEDAHDGIGRIVLRFSDGLIEIVLTISTSESDGKIEFRFLMVSGKVLPKYLVNVKDNRPDITYFSLFNRHDQAEFAEKLSLFNKAIDDFIEWYFDLSGTYGKVKLFKTFYNVVEGYHDSNQARFVAIAGDFMCTDEVGGTRAMKVEPRIL